MMASTPTGAGRIFISYRREETAYPAGWLFDRLVEHFGQGQVFKDVDSIQLGDDFVEVITAAVAGCDVLLALIGDQWLTITGEDGRRRLEDPSDFVRLEIEAALARNIRVIPVLVDGARMPRGRGFATQPGQACAPTGARAEPQPLRFRHRATAQGARQCPRRGTRPPSGHRTRTPRPVRTSQTRHGHPESCPFGLLAAVLPSSSDLASWS